MKISLVIPAYNEEKYIGSCLEYAIASCGEKLFEIIVIDNASTDKTGEIAKSFAGVKVIYEEKKGLTRARERGFRESQGDIIWYIDADTRMPLGWYDTVVKEFSKDKNLACLTGPHVYFDIPKWQQIIVKLFWYFPATILYWMVGYMVIGVNFAIRRDVLVSMNGFDTTIEFYGEDTNIARRAHEFGKVKFMPSFGMPTSGRRLSNLGLWRTFAVYTSNHLSEIFIRKPITKKYVDFR